MLVPDSRLILEVPSFYYKKRIGGSLYGDLSPNTQKVESLDPSPEKEKAISLNSLGKSQIKVLGGAATKN